jgi:hypothetical protein
MLAMLAGNPLSADETFETLKAGSETYTNVTVLNKTDRYVFIKHAGGSINLKVKDLAAEDLKKLGYTPAEPAKPSALASNMQALTEKVRKSKVGEFMRGMGGSYEEKLKSRGVDPRTFFIVVGAVSLLFHLFYSFCSFLICTKVGQKPGILVWLPLLQLIPLHRAAGISPWLILLYFIPPISLFVFVYWCVKICHARGKSAWLVILVFIPLLNLLFIPCLAFSSADGEDEITPRSIELS